MKLARSVAWSAFAAGFGIFTAGASAAEDYQARSWAASCAACHGTGGRSVGGMPALAGKRKEDLAGMLKAFKSGSRPGTLMHQHAKGYTDEQLDRIAAYFAAQKP